MCLCVCTYSYVYVNMLCFTVNSVIQVFCSTSYVQLKVYLLFSMYCSYIYCILKSFKISPENSSGISEISSLARSTQLLHGNPLEFLWKC